MESFFGTLKSEFFRLNRVDHVEQLRQGLRRYIHYDNHHRFELKPKGLSPVEYRTQALGLQPPTVQLLEVSSKRSPFPFERPFSGRN
jgi:transposase InsO family protein